MTKAIRIHTNGGPEVMKWEDVPTPEPGPGEALIHQHAVGLNYIDVYFRTGLYKAPGMPLIIGSEGAGTVTAVGAGVTVVQPGDRVAYAGPMGGYSTDRVLPADRLVKLPDGKLLIPGVVAHATNGIEHPELVAWRIKNFASVVGRENLIAGTSRLSQQPHQGIHAVRKMHARPERSAPRRTPGSSGAGRRSSTGTGRPGRR